ncbi:hypothetical protein N8590_02120 [bacterium]|nr:hypothetical protein [bacterium]
MSIFTAGAESRGIDFAKQGLKTVDIKRLKESMEPGIDPSTY